MRCRTHPRQDPPSLYYAWGPDYRTLKSSQRAIKHCASWSYLSGCGSASAGAGGGGEGSSHCGGGGGGGGCGGRAAAVRGACGIEEPQRASRATGGGEGDNSNNNTFLVASEPPVYLDTAEKDAAGCPQQDTEAAELGAERRRGHNRYSPGKERVVEEKSYQLIPKDHIVVAEDSGGCGGAGSVRLRQLAIVPWSELQDPAAAHASPAEGSGDEGLFDLPETLPSQASAAVESLMKAESSAFDQFQERRRSSAGRSLSSIPAERNGTMLGLGVSALVLGVFIGALMSGARGGTSRVV
jgi:hypothetical protein